VKYVGLTNDLERRKFDRKRDINDAVSIHISKTKITPNIIKLTEYLPIEEAIEKEKYYHDKYLNSGWKMLNRRKTGSLGGSKFNI
jgi:adenine C2-methylase RlmN of 23S rRNA A2503 and tRNA A37